MPDYTEVLKQIATALKQPSMPGWQIALLGAGIGAFGTAMVQLLLRLFDEHRERTKLRRVLYSDLAEMFNIVDQALVGLRGNDDMETWAMQEHEIRRLLNFRGEDHMNKNQTVYMQLTERPVADTLYRQFHRIANEKGSFFVNTGVALRMFATFVQQGHLKSKYFKSFIHWHGFLLARVRHHYEEEQELLARAIQTISIEVPPEVNSGPGSNT